MKLPQLLYAASFVSRQSIIQPLSIENVTQFSTSEWVEVMWYNFNSKVSPVIQSSSPVQYSNPVHNPVQQLEMVLPVAWWSPKIDYKYHTMITCDTLDTEKEISVGWFLAIYFWERAYFTWTHHKWCNINMNWSRINQNSCEYVLYIYMAVYMYCYWLWYLYSIR